MYCERDCALRRPGQARRRRARLEQVVEERPYGWVLALVRILLLSGRLLRSQHFRPVNGFLELHPALLVLVAFHEDTCHFDAREAFALRERHVLLLVLGLGGFVDAVDLLAQHLVLGLELVGAQPQLVANLVQRADLIAEDLLLAAQLVQLGDQVVPDDVEGVLGGQQFVVLRDEVLHLRARIHLALTLVMLYPMHRPLPAFGSPSLVHLTQVVSLGNERRTRLTTELGLVGTF